MVGTVERLGDGVLDHGVDAALPDLVHQVPAHALRLHPLERVLRRPVPAQPDLDEVPPEHGTRFDQPAHRRAVAGEVAVDDVGGVGVGVEVDDADVAPAAVIGDGRGRRPGDRVVAAEDHRDDAAARHLGDLRFDVGVADLGLAVRAVGVAVVDDLDPVEDLDAEIQVVRARFVGVRADGAGAEPRASAVRGVQVERRADDGDIGLPLVELFGVGEERALPERRQPSVGVAEVELLAHPRREHAPGGRASHEVPVMRGRS